MTTLAQASLLMPAPENSSDGTDDTRSRQSLGADIIIANAPDQCRSDLEARSSRPTTLCPNSSLPTDELIEQVAVQSLSVRGDTGVHGSVA